MGEGTDNSTIESILRRRSIRSGYARERAVDRATLELVTRCGAAAPSSKNAQPWRLHVVTAFETLDAIAAEVEGAPGISEYVPHDPRTGTPHPHWSSTVRESAAVLREVPAAIVIENRGVFSGRREALQTATPDALSAALVSYGFEALGIGTCLENMWIAAVSLGLQAAFLGDILIAEAPIAAILGLEGNLAGALALGYSETAPGPALESPPETRVADPVVWH